MSLRFKAYQRLAQAYSAIGNKEKSAETYEKLHQSLDFADLPIEKIRKMKNDCMQAVKIMKSDKTTSTSHNPSLDLSEHTLDI